MNTQTTATPCTRQLTLHCNPATDQPTTTTNYQRYLTKPKKAETEESDLKDEANPVVETALVPKPETQPQPRCGECCPAAQS